MTNTKLSDRQLWGEKINTNLASSSNTLIMPLIMNACKKLHNGYSVEA